MKTILTFILIINSIALNAKTFELNVVDTYLGKVNGEDLYYSKTKSFDNPKDIDIYSYKDGFFTEKHSVLSKNDVFIELFIRNNQFYLIGYSTEYEKLFISLTKFNESSEEIESNVIFENSEKDNTQLKYTFILRENTFGIYLKRTKTHSNFYAYNLKNDKKASYSLLKESIYAIECEDIIVNEQLEMNIVFGYTGKVISSPITFKDKHNYKKTYTVTCSKTSVTAYDLPVRKNDLNALSYKFIEDENGQLFLISLLFSAKKGRKNVGYAYSKFNYSNTRIIDFTHIINEKLKNEENWQSKDYKRWKQNKYDDNFFKQKLKKLIFYKEKLYIFSQAHYVDAAVTAMTPGANYTGVPGPSINYETGTRSGFVGNFCGESTIYLKDINISSVNLSSNTVDWTYLTGNLMAILPKTFYHNFYEPSFFIHFKNDQLTVLCNLPKNNFNKYGEILKHSGRHRKLFKDQKTVITSVAIDLNSGKSETRPITEDLSNLTTESMSPYLIISKDNDEFTIFKFHITRSLYGIFGNILIPTTITIPDNK